MKRPFIFLALPATAAFGILSAPVFAQESAKIILPTSDLVNASKPYVLTAELDGGIYRGFAPA